MPPSPTITASLNEPVCERLLRDLDIPAPRVTFKEGRTDKTISKHVYGYFDPAPYTVTIMLGWDFVTRDRLMAATNEVGRTFIHEMRHAWQWHHDRKLFSDVVRCEEDAREFEDQLARYRGIVRLARRQHNSPFSRLASAQARVRQNM